MNSSNRIAAKLYSLGHSLSQECKYKYPEKRDDDDNDDDDNTANV